MVRKSRPPSLPHPTMEYLLEYENGFITEERTCRQRWCRYCIITGIVILTALLANVMFLIFSLVLALLIFLGFFVILPVVFMHSYDLQRSVVFATWNIKENQDYSNFRKYAIQGVRNFYVPVTNANETIELGVWHVLPLINVYDAVENEHYNYAEALRNSPLPVVLYFHGTGGSRITNNNMYRVQRQFFHVIAFDYRSYGDSTEGELSEEAVVQEGIFMYKWLRTQTNAKIYVWGYSLGTGISTHVVARLRKEGIIPMGLFLESPFTSLREELDYFPVTKLFAWMPWFEATIADPLYESGFRFKTVENILSVDCPVLIVHAEDDPIVPYVLGKKLSRVSQEMRSHVQGNVTFHSFPPQFKFGHMKIYEAVELPGYIKTHIEICEQFNMGRT